MKGKIVLARLLAAPTRRLSTHEIHLGDRGGHIFGHCILFSSKRRGKLKGRSSSRLLAQSENEYFCLKRKTTKKTTSEAALRLRSKKRRKEKGTVWALKTQPFRGGGEAKGKEREGKEKGKREDQNKQEQRKKRRSCQRTDGSKTAKRRKPSPNRDASVTLVCDMPWRRSTDWGGRQHEPRVVLWERQGANLKGSSDSQNKPTRTRPLARAASQRETPGRRCATLGMNTRRLVVLSCPAGSDVSRLFCDSSGLRLGSLTFSGSSTSSRPKSNVRITDSCCHRPACRTQPSCVLPGCLIEREGGLCLHLGGEAQNRYPSPLY